MMDIKSFTHWGARGWVGDIIHSEKMRKSKEQHHTKNQILYNFHFFFSTMDIRNFKYGGAQFRKIRKSQEK